MLRESPPDDLSYTTFAINSELLAEYAVNAAPSNPQKEYGYRNGQLLITAEAPTRTNVALASNGGTAVASSYLGPPYNYFPSYVNDGARTSGSTDLTPPSWGIPNDPIAGMSRNRPKWTSVPNGRESPPCCGPRS